jgi:cell division septation protein DedD
MADEGLHEIQLNGKQLVFLFMASTVVAVVIFLCGVMVGRGVRAQRTTELTEASVDAVTDPTAVTQGVPPARASGAAASTAGTRSGGDETLTYPNLLEGQEPPDETLKEPVAPRATVTPPPLTAKHAAAASVATIPAPTKALPLKAVPTNALSAKAVSPNAVPPKAVPTKAVPTKALPPNGVSTGVAPATPGPTRLAPVQSDSSQPTSTNQPAARNTSPAVTGEPRGNGFVVQVAAVNDRGQAETIARRLAGKGYPSFITTPGARTPGVFRVRIGKYRDRREAQSVATRLAREEQFKPWITR